MELVIRFIEYLGNKALSVNKIWLVYVIIQEKPFYQKNYTKNAAWKLVQAFLSLKRLRQNLSWKMKCSKHVDYVGHVIAKLSKYVKLSIQTSSDSYLQRILYSNEFPISSLGI